MRKVETEEVQNWWERNIKIGSNTLKNNHLSTRECRTRECRTRDVLATRRVKPQLFHRGEGEMRHRWDWTGDKHQGGGQTHNEDRGEHIGKHQIPIATEHNTLQTTTKTNQENDTMHHPGLPDHIFILDDISLASRLTVRNIVFPVWLHP